MSERISDLALLGGQPMLDQALAPFNTIGEAERRAVEAVLDTGVLSGFVGAPGPDFNGGPAVRELEARWCDRFNCTHAVSVNSATSGLYAAIAAAGVGPGDEVIVPPYTMSATCIAPLVYGGIPVFVDIERDHFCLDPDLVEAAITPKTRAILTVNLFGHPAALGRLRQIADKHGLILIEDNAQAPLAKENGRFTGTIGHIGVFSLNRHKHIQTGEGG
ncbi:MAG: DegT/DnrJ/EryC1/StrS family aminotransferase, partial [Muricauda sp. TMED12]